ncbi:MAG TPA: tetratricopeptide repeat protein [Tepidisphaeraceae bacterium]|nr:tetratricopeptide repeat protein [Tepidisphaeraceae bacterium]
MKQPPDSKQKLTEQWKAARAGVQYTLAKQAYEIGDIENSRKSCDQALALNPKLAAALVLSAKLSIEKGQLDRADAALKQAREIDPKNPEPDYYQGVVYQRWQKPQQALEAYTHASEKAPSEPAYLLARAETLVALDKSTEALAILQDKVAFFESSAAIRDAIGQILQQQGKNAEAVTMFREASMLSPDDLGIRERLALGLFYANQYQDALEHLTKLMKLDAFARRGDLLAALGECQLQLDRPRDARDSYESAAQATPGVPEVWLGMARVALKLNDQQRAELALRKAIALAPDNPQAHLLTGYLRLRENRLPEALVSFQKASQLDARDTVGLCMLGYVQEKLGHPDQALALYGQALKLNPKDDFASKLMASLDLHE